MGEPSVAPWSRRLGVKPESSRPGNLRVRTRQLTSQASEGKAVHQDWLPGDRQGNTGPRRRAVRHDYDDSYGPKRHRTRRRSLKKRWILIPAVAVAAILAAGVAVASTGIGGIRFRVVSPVTVQALGVNLRDAAIGQPVTAGAKVVAERESVLPEVAIAVTGPDGKRTDFPHVTGWKLGTSQKIFSQTKAFDTPGKYTYWFTYKKNNSRWVDLNPKQSFTVGSSDATTDPTSPTTPGATPSPSESTGSPGSTPAPGTSTTAPAPRPTTSAGSPSSTTNPSLRGCAASPGSCGYPTTATAGVPAGTPLTVINGNYTITTAGAVVEGKDIRGCVDVRAANVTIRNSKVTGQCFWAIETGSAGGTTTIERVEISCINGSGTGIDGPNFKARAVHIHDCENGLEINSNSSIVDSVISAREGTSTAHGDGIQSQGGSNVVIRHNTMLQVNPVTSAIITNPTQNNGWVVEDNLMGGGAYTLYCPEQGTNFVVRNNRFVPAKTGGLYSAAYGLTDACNHAGIVWSGNIRDTDGSVVNP